MDFKELKWFYNQGFALHWLHPKSKMPKGADWQKGPRKEWDKLKKEYKPKDNVGVRTGEPSKLTDGTYLMLLDIDIKSGLKEDALAAYAVAEKFLGRKMKDAIRVRSGRGGYSLHCYFKTTKPHASFNLIRSPKMAKVLMPSMKPAKRDKEKLTEKELNKGYRIRAAFEIDVYGTGKQAVVPPSIHPDTGKTYEWLLAPTNAEEIPLVKEKAFSHLKAVHEAPLLKKQAKVTAIEVDLYSLKLSAKAMALIEEMEGLDAYGGDRSAAFFGVISEMVKKNKDDSTICSVLSDPLYAISEVVIDRVGTDFNKCCSWILPQIYKLRQQGSVERAFADVEDDLFEGTDWLVKSDHSSDGKAIYDELGGWEIELDRNQQGATKMNLKNCSLYLRNELKIKDWLGFNQFTNEVEFLGEPPWAKAKTKKKHWTGVMLTDSDVIAARLMLSRRKKFEPTGHMMLEAMIHEAQVNAFHPVREYLKTLSFDGVERIDSWMSDYLGASDTAYTRAVGRKMLVGAITRVMKPGSKFDHCVILDGPQDKGKSTALQVLSEPWFCDSLGDVTNKDVIQQLQGSWIIEVGELDAMDKASTNAFKQFLTKQEDKARLAYKALAQKFPRQCIFVGTTNDEEYLRDQTGNRRFWPVNVAAIQDIDITGLREVRDQLWAEAYLLYKAGTEKLWLDDPKIKAMSEEIQREKMLSDPWEELIEKWVKSEIKLVLKPGPAGATYPQFRTSIPAIWAEVLNKSASSMTKYEQMRVANCLKKLGFSKFKTGGNKYWQRPFTQKELARATKGPLKTGQGGPTQNADKSMH